MPSPSPSPARLQFLATLTPGDVVHGTVARVEPFGALIHLDEGPEPELGYVPPPELTWRWVSPTEKVVTEGQRISAEVLALDTALRGQAVLSLCALEENPWKKWSSRTGTVVTGHVTRNFVPYGVFIAIGDGIGGLLPYSELPRETLPLGTELTVRVTQVEVPQRRMHLSLENLPPQNSYGSD